MLGFLIFLGVTTVWQFAFLGLFATFIGGNAGFGLGLIFLIPSVFMGMIGSRDV